MSSWTTYYSLLHERYDVSVAAANAIPNLGPRTIELHDVALTFANAGNRPVSIHSAVLNVDVAFEPTFTRWEGCNWHQHASSHRFAPERFTPIVIEPGEMEVRTLTFAPQSLNQDEIRQWAGGQQTHLRTCIEIEHFSGPFGMQTIRRMLSTSTGRFGGSAIVSRGASITIFRSQRLF